MRKIMSRPRIFVTQPVASSALDRLRKVATVKVNPDASRVIPKRALIAAVCKCDILFCLLHDRIDRAVARIDPATNKVVAKVHGSTVVAQISGIHTREEALALKGSKVSVRREALAEPEEGHYYHADLLGLEVLNGRGEVLGVVKRLFTNGAQDVMEVAENGKPAGKLRLLPWVAAVVKEVDLAEKRIVVEWETDW